MIFYIIYFKNNYQKIDGEIINFKMPYVEEKIFFTDEEMNDYYKHCPEDFISKYVFDSESTAYKHYIKYLEESVNEIKNKLNKN